MSDVQIVKVDDGGVNARILARQTKADFRRIEAASVKMPVRFTSAEGKRLFVRMFNTLQLNTHFISVIARTRLDHDDIAKIESAVRSQIDQVAERLNQSIDEAEALFKAHGITSSATYDALPLDLEVHVLSSLSRRYLEVLGKLDQLMPLLQTLEIHEVLSSQQLDLQRASIKRQVRNVANGARSYATGLRRRMNLLARTPPVGAGVAAAGSGAETLAGHEPPAPTEAGEVDLAVGLVSDGDDRPQVIERLDEVVGLSQAPQAEDACDGEVEAVSWSSPIPP